MAKIPQYQSAVETPQLAKVPHYQSAMAKNPQHQSSTVNDQLSIAEIPQYWSAATYIKAVQLEDKEASPPTPIPTGKAMRQNHWPLHCCSLQKSPLLLPCTSPQGTTLRSQGTTSHVPILDTSLSRLCTRERAHISFKHSLIHWVHCHKHYCQYHNKHWALHSLTYQSLMYHIMNLYCPHCPCWNLVQPILSHSQKHLIGFIQYHSHQSHYHHCQWVTPLTMTQHPRPPTPYPPQLSLKHLNLLLATLTLVQTGLEHHIMMQPVSSAATPTKRIKGAPSTTSLLHHSGHILRC